MSGVLVDHGWIVSTDRKWAPYGSDRFLSRMGAIRAALKGTAMIGAEHQAICLAAPLTTFWVGRLEVRTVGEDGFATEIHSPKLVRPVAAQAS